MSNFQDVADFNDRFDVPRHEKPGLLDHETYEYRVKFLKEELQEFIDAHERGDLEDAFDSLLDLVYVADGTAYMMGISEKRWQAGWDEVQRANMSKVRATKASDSKRGSAIDVVKPAGFRKPDIQGVLDTPEEEL